VNVAVTVIYALAVFFAFLILKLLNFHLHSLFNGVDVVPEEAEKEKEGNKGKGKEKEKESEQEREREKERDVEELPKEESQSEETETEERKRRPSSTSSHPEILNASEEQASKERFPFPIGVTIGPFH